MSIKLCRPCYPYTQYPPPFNLFPYILLLFHLILLTLISMAPHPTSTSDTEGAAPSFTTKKSTPLVQDSYKRFRKGEMHQTVLKAANKEANKGFRPKATSNSTSQTTSSSKRKSTFLPQDDDEYEDNATSEAPVSVVPPPLG